MTDAQQDSIPGLLLQSIPRDLVMGIEEGLNAGAQRAFASAKGMEEGHLPHVVGQLRHFHMNEAFHRALVLGEVSPTSIQGNGLVTGRAGVFTLARFNIPAGFWINGRRSQMRRRMSVANRAIEPLLQPELFEVYVRPSQAVAFFVACFSGSLRVLPEAPVSIQIAVPDRSMHGWLFREPLGTFLQRYERESAMQDDLATPKLKKGVRRSNDGNP